MKQDLLLEYLNYNIDKILFTNKNFLNELLEILQKHYGLNENLKDFNFYEKSIILTYGFYDNLEKKIYLNKKLIDNVKTNNKVLVNNFILETLFHELFHAYESMIIESDSTLSSLLKDSYLVFKGKLWNNKETNKPGFYSSLMAAKMYSNHQSLYPNERMANSISNHFMLELYNIMNEENKKLSLEIKRDFMNRYLEDYIISTTCITPLEQFYSKTGMIERLNSYDFSTYSNYFRFMMGELKSANDILKVQDDVVKRKTKL